MMRDKWICLVCLGLIFIVSAGAFGSDNFNREIINKVIAYYNLDTASTEVEIIRNGISTPPQDYDSLTVSPLNDAPADGLTPLFVNVYLKSGETVRCQVRARIRRFADVLVTNDRLKQHEIVAADKVTLERMEITSLTEKPLSETTELKGKWTTRSINKGQILLTGLFEEIPAVMSGQGVSILYRNSNLEIMAAGTALEAGYKDETIRVRNKQSGRIINCAIIDGETVQVSAL